MPNPMKVQPVNSIGDLETLREPVRADPGKPVFKSRLRRLFDRQFPSVLKNSSTEKSIAAAAAETQHLPQWSATKDEVGGAEFEPSSLCLAKMVQNFIEENNEKQQITSGKCGRNRCNCFHGNSNDSSDDELDGFHDSISSSSPVDVGDFLKSLISCGSVAERNLLADTSRIVEKNKLIKRKDDLREIVADGLSSAGYDASICKSRWDKSPAYPAGEYEYIDVLMEEGERVIIDIDFRSEFEIARSTGSYKSILQLVPFIFVGKGERLQQIVSMVCEAGRQSLKKKGMPFPPWRKAEYMRSKWLAAHTRVKQQQEEEEIEMSKSSDNESEDGGELDLIFGEKETESVNPGEVEVMKPAWHPPPIKPKSCERSGKAVVTGLAFLLRDISISPSS
uniref:Uncharacterized protein n=1 Tax=Kalanchoe fedtschenkoi TaxID=63787 RepID=A0A7N0TTF8_KALFE